MAVVTASDRDAVWIKWLWPGILVLISLTFLVARNSAEPAQQVLFDNMHWTISNGGAAMLAWLGYRRAAGNERSVQRWFAIGLGSYAVGQLIWDLQVWSGWNPFPAPADLFYAACGPCLAMGLWRCLCQRVPAQRVPVLALDITLLMVQVLAIILMLYLAQLPALSWLQFAQLAAYPIAMFGAAIIGVVMAIALGLRLHSRWLLLLFGLVLTGLLWMRWNALVLVGTPPAGSWLNFGFSLVALLCGVGAAYWQVPREPPREPSQRAEPNFGFFLFLPLLMVMSAVAMALLVWSQSPLPPLLRIAVTLAAAVVIVLSVLRQGLGLAAHERVLQAERQVAASERQYQVLAQRFELASASAHLGIWEMDLQRKTAIWNERMYQLYGYAADTDKQPYEIWEQGVLPEDLAKARQLLQQASRSHSIYAVDFRVVTPAGELRHLQASAVIQYDASGMAVRAVGTTWDVTEQLIARRALAESEAELRAIFDNSVIGIVLADSKRNILRSNRAAREFLGYSADQAAAIHANDIIHPDELALTEQMFNSVVAGKRNSYQLEKRYRRANAEYLWVRVTVYPVELHVDQCFVVLIEDIAQRKQVETELQQAQHKQLRAREEFAFRLLNVQEQERLRIANELHDSLGQSLSLIKNRTQLALEQASSEPLLVAQLQGILRVAADAIAETRGLAHNLRPIHIEQLGLTAALSQLLEQFDGAHQLHIERRIEAIDDAFPATQLTHIYRLVQEALNNIGKHAGATTVNVCIERDIKAVHIVIQDNGRGFDLGQVPLGLGLTSMTERAHMLGGTLHIDTQPDAGTRISIELPIAEASAELS